MKSVRFDSALEEALERAAAARGETLSEFVRQAVTDRVDATFDAPTEVDFTDVLGVVHGGGGRARRTSAAFTEALASTEPPA